MPANPSIKREPIPIATKDYIRSHYRQNQNLSIKDMVAWAEEKYENLFLPATMRTILFPKLNKSGALNSLPTAHAEGLRERVCNWPELENELASWYKSLSAPPKGEELKEKAKELWKTLAPKHYIGQKSPAFGDSWRDKFKCRHGLKLKKQDASCSSQDQVSAIRVAGGCAKPYREVEAANAVFFYNVNHGVWGNRGIHQFSSPFADSQHQETIHDPEFSKDSQSSNWKELGGLLTGERFPGPPLASSTLSIKLNDNMVPEGAPRITQPSWHTKNLSPLGSEHLNFQPDVSKNGASHFGVDVNVSAPESSDSAESRPRFEIQIPQNKSGRQVLNNQKLFRFDNVWSIDPGVLHDSERDTVIRESVFSLLHLSPEYEQRDSTISVERIIKALIFDLESAESNYAPSNGRLCLCQYHKSVYNRLGANIHQSMKALRLLHSAKNNIEVETPSRKEWSDWELDLINNFLVSSPPPSSPSQGYHDEQYGTTTTNNLNSFRKDMLRQRYWDDKKAFLKKHQTSIFSMISSLGRIDVRTSTFLGLNTPDEDDFMAEVILTLHDSAQLRFFLPPAAALGHNFSVTPIISIRKTIPYGSAIFTIAASGTVGELTEMFSSGKASLNDCDPDGRSLINYALDGLNLETSYYLLNFLGEVYTYEIENLGRLVPLVAITPWNFIEMTNEDQERRLRCLTKMLDMGADLSLEFDTGDEMPSNTFENELYMYSKEVLEAILNSEQPLVNANSFGSDNLSETSPIMYLANWVISGAINVLDMIDKFIILIKRGADINSTDMYGNNCLHKVLAYHLKPSEIESYYDYFKYKSILMLLITAGIDVEALNDFGRTPSDIAFLYGNEEVWIESLAACGHNPWDIISLDNSFIRKRPGENVFLATKIEPRPEKLSFQELLSSEEFSGANKRNKLEEYWEHKCSPEERLSGNLIGCYISRMAYVQKKAFFGLIGIDTEDEHWYGRPHVCGRGLSAEKIVEGISNPLADHYMPINGDSSWLTYVYRPQYIFFLVGHDPRCKLPYHNGSTDDEGDDSEYGAHEDWETYDEIDEDGYFGGGS